MMVYTQAVQEQVDIAIEATRKHGAAQELLRICKIIERTFDATTALAIVKAITIKQED